MNENISQIFDVDQLAIIGASEDVPIFGSLYNNITTYGAEQDLFLVNPNRETVRGKDCYSSVTEINEPIDLAVIIVSAPHVVDVFEECCIADVKTALIIASGFGEMGEKGQEREKRLIELSQEHDLPFCGPNSLGLVSVHDDLATMISPLSVVDEGAVGLISQSGSLMVEVYRSGIERGLGFSKIIDGGNQSVFSAADYIEDMVEDENTEVITAIIEGFAKPRKFIRVAKQAAEKGKPVIVLKLASSQEGKDVARSHTGTLTSSSDVVNAVFDQTLVAGVDSLAALVEAAEISLKAKRVEGNRVAVVDNSGGGATLFSDVIAETSLKLAELETESKNRLQELLPPIGTHSNPLDTGVPWHYSAMDKIAPQLFDILATDKNVDVAVIRLEQTLDSARIDEFLTNRFEEIVEVNADTDTQFVVSTRPTYKTFDEWTEVIRGEEVPAVQSYKLGIAALDRYVEFETEEVQIEELSPAGDSIDIEDDKSVLHEFDAKRVLAEQGFPVTEEAIASTKQEAIELASEIGYPVCLKIVSSDIVHKTDLDAVVVGIDDVDSAATAYERILTNVEEKAPDANVEGVLVQEMISDGVEVLLGAKQTPFGTAIVVGSGGTLAEILDDTAIRIAPFSKSTARDMIESLQGYELLEGVRGSTGGNVDSLAEFVSDFSTFAADMDTIQEIDLNPVLVTSEGAYAVDAVFELE